MRTVELSIAIRVSHEGDLLDLPLLLKLKFISRQSNHCALGGHVGACLANPKRIPWLPPTCTVDPARRGGRRQMDEGLRLPPYCRDALCQKLAEAAPEVVDATPFDIDT